VSKPSAPRRARALCMASVVAIIAVALLTLSTPYRPSIQKSAAAAVSPQVTPITQAQRDRLQANFAALPLAFEQNAGQIDPQVKFTARANGYTLFLTNNDAVFSFRAKSSMSVTARSATSDLHGKNRSETNQNSVDVVRMQLVDASTLPHLKRRSRSLEKRTTFSARIRRTGTPASSNLLAFPIRMCTRASISPTHCGFLLRGCRSSECASVPLDADGKDYSDFS